MIIFSPPLLYLKLAFQAHVAVALLKHCRSVCTGPAVIAPPAAARIAVFTADIPIPPGPALCKMANRLLPATVPVLAWMIVAREPCTTPAAPKPSAPKKGAATAADAAVTVIPPAIRLAA